MDDSAERPIGHNPTVKYVTLVALALTAFGATGHVCDTASRIRLAAIDSAVQTPSLVLAVLAGVAASLPALWVSCYSGFRRYVSIGVLVTATCFLAVIVVALLLAAVGPAHYPIDDTVRRWWTPLAAHAVGLLSGSAIAAHQRIRKTKERHGAP